MPVSPNTDRLKLLLKNNTMTKVTATTAVATTLSASASRTTGIQTHVNSSGAYVEGLNTVVKNITWAAGDVIDSGAIYIPKNGLLTKCTYVVTSDLAYASSTLTVRAGTSAGAQQFIAAGALASSATTLVRGKGISTDQALSPTLGAPTSASFVADSLNFDAAAALHMQVSASAGAFTTGSVSFSADFIYMGNTV